ncbi:hypothetical protein VP01_2063g3 [Puccinia sorghi]|uniref:Uncharacterized protein n=1 Tax=Puccinia sorghi TaxID=27349 RepID=A0A0L6VCF5_9BASI|nr:hypothetical protein VP01_2063g3 [Puccinia sorghi]
MDVEPANVTSLDSQRITQTNEKAGHRTKDGSGANTGTPSSLRLKGRGTKSRMINVGGNRFESPSHSSRHKTDSVRSSSSRRANIASQEWLSNSLEDSQMSPRSTIKIVDKELASQYHGLSQFQHHIGDPFLEDDAPPSLSNALAEPNSGTTTSREPLPNHPPESTIVVESDPSNAIASPPGSPLSS